MHFPFRSWRHRLGADPDHLALQHTVSIGATSQQYTVHAGVDESSNKTVDEISNDYELDHVGNSDAHSEGKCSGIDKFQFVFEQTDWKQVTRLATHLRIREVKLARSAVLRRLQTLRLSCKVILTPLHGSHNILFPIRFRDGVQWLLKLPFNGTRDQWDKQSAAALTSEVLTIKLISDNTSIPVPRIFAFDASPDNPVKSPFILMEQIKGDSLFFGWFYKKSPDDRNSFREHALNELAEAMVQLKSLRFSRAGALQFIPNNEGEPLGIGAYRKVDHFAEYSRIKMGDRGTTTYSQQGPFCKQEDYFLTSLDREDAEMLPPRLQSQRKLLRLFIKWFFQATGDSSNFVLTHPDFNLQNILVGDDGMLRGLIDWDGVVVVPECIGYEEYPLWLTSDWDPHWWNYSVEHEVVIDEDRPVMLPAELEHYRNVYARSFEAALRRSNLSAHHDNHPFSKTKVSSLARSLYIAANEPLSLPYNVALIFDKIDSLTSSDDYNYTSDYSGSDGQSETQSHHTHHIQRPLAIQDNVQVFDFGAEIQTKVDNNQLTTHIKWDSRKNLQQLSKVSEVNAQSEGNISNTVETCSDQHIFVDPQKHKDYDTTASTSWSQPIFKWVIMAFLYLLCVPAWFLLLMDWLQSADILPLAASSVGLLFSANRLVSNLVALLLGSLSFARIVDKIFQDPSSGCQHPFSYRHSEGNALRGLQEPESHIYSGHDQKTTPPTTYLDNMSNVIDEVRLEQSEKIVKVDNSYSCSSDDVSTVRSTQSEEAKSECEDHHASESSRSSKSLSPAEVLHSESTQTSIDLHSNQEPAENNIDDFRDGDSASISSDEQLELIQKKWEEDPLYDSGYFTEWNVYNAIYKGTLDQYRMRRLKIGFQRLLASLDDRFADFDGLTLGD